MTGVDPDARAGASGGQGGADHADQGHGAGTADLCDTPEALWHPSPNFGPRRHGGDPSLVVVHYTAMTSAAAALDRLCDPAAEVSAHYLISARGQVWQMVRESDRAWHAGAGFWAGCADVNSHSIGIELDNSGAVPFAAPLMTALEGLLAGIQARWRIAPEGVIAHSDLAPGRKADPGRRFDWRRLARRGLAIWPEDGRAGERTSGFDPQADFAADLDRIGYPPASDIQGPDADTLLTAFRLRFRPQGQGPLCDADRQVARAAAALVRGPGAGV